MANSNPDLDNDPKKLVKVTIITQQAGNCGNQSQSWVILPVEFAE